MITRKRFARLASTGLCAALAFVPAHAATFCASTAAELQSALLFGTLQNQAYTIKIVQGTYQMNTSLLFTFSAPTTIEGGYTANCSARNANAENTVIDMGSIHGIVWSQHAANPEAQINVDGLTIQHMTSMKLYSGKFNNTLESDDFGSVSLRRMRITQFTAAPGQIAIDVFALGGGVRLENVLIDHIDAPEVCAVQVSSAKSGSIRINHMTADLDGANDFCLGHLTHEAQQISVHNSILWNSDGGQSIFRAPPSTFLDSDTTVDFVNNIFHDEAMGAITTVTNQINADPKWLNPAAGNYALSNNFPPSPAINAGTIGVPGGEPPTDFRGLDRIIGVIPDLGAYENQSNISPVLTVTNTADAGPGSLRQAITDAELSLGIAKTIKFDIRNAFNVPICPAVISLNSVLPAINLSTILIDGYTQPTSTTNTDVDAFNANLCIMLKPAPGSLGTGLRVPETASASLTVRGLGFGGFGQALQILGGKDHVIAGNQFGGVANGVILPGAGLSAISIGLSATGKLIVGGQGVADRNVIGGAGINGVLIQSGINSAPEGCQIINNLIGLAPNGQAALTNGWGVNVGASKCAIIRNRVAGNTFANILLNGGNGNIVQQNQIGLTAQGGGLINSVIGVLVTGSNNLIGASGNGGAIAGNVIRFNNQGGVVIRGATAVGNSVKANLLGDNGFDGFVGEHMDIDLQASAATVGPDANDVGDIDDGANKYQNFPVPTGLVYTAPGTLDRPATVSGVLDSKPGSYRVDVYFSGSAHNGRGHAEVFLGTTTVTISAINPRPETFSKNILVPNQLPAGVISFTATDSLGNTSEVGTAISIVSPNVFASSFE